MQLSLAGWLKGEGGGVILAAVPPGRYIHRQIAAVMGGFLVPAAIQCRPGEWWKCLTFSDG